MRNSNTRLNTSPNARLNTWAAIGCLTLLLPLLPSTALAAGNHDETPAAQTGIAAPSVTATSDAFELVGRLENGELAVLIDRADTNEPVLGATLSVELDGRSADAPFEAEHGAYSLTDATLLAQLGHPGVHALVFTLIAGEESDLLTGELDVHEEDDHPTAAGSSSLSGWQAYATWVGAALAALAALYGTARLFRGGNRTQTTGGAA